MCETYYGASRGDEYARAVALGRWVHNNYPGQPRLHEAGCYHIGAGRSGILNYEKIVCAGEIDCILETLRSRGLQAIRGGCCPRIPDATARGADRSRKVAVSAGAGTTATSQATGREFPSPCRESWVEDQVAEFLTSSGYEISRQVAGPTGGTIDLVAKSGEEVLVIEAKGEDKGGYTSAEMNFQMGLGQIASRMTDDATLYLIAFPLTSDFRRVIHRYRSTKAFVRLHLGALVVHGPQEVRRYDPEQFTEFLTVAQQ